MKSTYLAVLALSLSFATAYANSEEHVLNSDPINVDGYLAERPVTDGELEQIRSEIRKQKNELQLNKQKTKGFRELSKTTEKLSETTENYLDEKKATQQEIAEYNAKIKCLMEEDPDRDCDKYLKAKEAQAEVHQPIHVTQAAPIISTTEISYPNGMSHRPFETIKLGLDAGVISYTSDNEELRADTMGIRVESNITERFSMSVGANYSSFKTEDFATNMYGGGSYNGYNNFYGMKGREIQYKSFAIEFGGKFFIVQTERFRPYLGAALGYNMANLKYSNNNSYNSSFGSQQYNFGNEAFKTNFASGSLAIGTEIMITRRIGMNVQGSYSSALGLSSADGKNRSNNPDQRRLGQLGEEVINASALTMTAGILLVF